MFNRDGSVAASGRLWMRIAREVLHQPLPVLAAAVSLTGLGATLWAINRFPENREIAANVLYQYLDFFFSGLKSKR